MKERCTYTDQNYLKDTKYTIPKTTFPSNLPVGLPVQRTELNDRIVVFVMVSRIGKKARSWKMRGNKFNKPREVDKFRSPKPPAYLADLG